MNKIQSIRGFCDIIENIETWHSIEKILKDISKRYGYHEVRTPLLEESRLFERSIGITSDIVHKEMYTFTDKNEVNLSLRPEGTASVVRACIENNYLYDQARKWFYLGSMFRRERPQKGRLRQFHQFGMECLGYDEPYPDIEQLIILNQAWIELEVSDVVTLELNYLGSRETRVKYAIALKAFYEPHLSKMTELNQKRWADNTLRLLDSKESDIIEINKNAPIIADFYSENERKVFDAIQKNCTSNHIKFVVNPRLMRGLDYYTGLIYEWKSDELGAQSTICGGGRYDLLFENLGAKKTGACGFSIGIERLIELRKHIHPTITSIQVHLVTPNEKNFPILLALGEKLRSSAPHLQFYTHLEAGKIGNLIKKSLKKAADIVIICADEELAKGKYSLKDLRYREQHLLDEEELKQHLEEIK